MAAPPPGSPKRLRSALDRVLVHDVKNMSFRLRLLLANMDEHWDDPEFRTTVRGLLASTVERLEEIAGRFVAHEDAVLIKVALDINALVREVARRPSRRGGKDAGKGPQLSLALGDAPRIWGDPYYVGDAIGSLVENAFEAAAPAGKVLVRTYAAGGVRRPRAVVEVIDNGAGMTAEFLRDRLFRPFETTKSEGVGLGLTTAQQIVRFHKGSLRILSQSGGGTLVRLSFPGIVEAAPGGIPAGSESGSRRRRSPVNGDPVSAVEPVGRIVVVEDDPFLLQQLTWTLKGKFTVSGARDATRGKALCESEPDLYLFDMRLPPSNQVQEGLDLLRHVRRRDPDATVVMMSGEGERSAALKAISLGAFDFFQKPIDPAELLLILGRALERRRLLAENRELRDAVQAPADPDRIVGESAPMKRMLADVRRIADSEATVLIVGESGTGKDLVARAIHAGSPRRARAFVAVNAAALPESLAEAELFGHEKGAFTGAVSSRPGRFELAQGGTLFLDEIGTLSAAVQSKLLRTLESREVERLGGRRPIPVDFRLVSATNESLEDRVAAGTFREDLFYRINAVVVRIPPLRERLEDLPLLARHFLSGLAARHGKGSKRLSDAVLERLRAHPWRGNVRELRHAVETLVLFSDGEEIGEEDLPRALRSGPETARSGSAGTPKDFASSVADYEKKLLSNAIAAAHGVKAEAARRLGLDSNQIKYLCRKYGL